MNQTVGNTGYNVIFENSLDGFAFHKIIQDEKGTPVDYVFLEVNNAFEKLTGLKKEAIIGKRVTEVLPGIATDPADWIVKYGEIASTGVSKIFENYAVSLNRWYRISAYSPEAGYFTTIFEDITDHKKLEDDLQRSNELLNAVTSEARVLIATVDKNYRYTFFNKPHHEELKRLTGKETEIGMSLVEVLSDMPEQQKIALALWNRALNGETIVQFTEFGEIGRYKRVYKTKHIPIRDNAGNVTGAGEVTEDVTESKRQEEILHESEERKRFALENMEAGEWDLDLVNHSAHRSLLHDRIFGYDTLLPKWTYEIFLEHVVKEDKEYVDRKFRDAMEKRGIWDFECRINRHDGVLRWIWARGRHVADSSGVLNRMVGIVMDITSRKKAEEERDRLLVEVQAEKEKLAALINSMQDEVWFTDTEGALTLKNPAAVQEFAMGSGDTVNIQDLATRLEVFRPDGTPRPAEESPPRRALAGEVVTKLEEIVRTPANGEFRYREVNASPVRDGKGTIIGSVSVVRDISDRHLVEKQLIETAGLLQKANDELEARVKHRTEELRSAFVYARSLLEANLDPLVTITVDGKIGDVNKAAVKITGRSKEEMLGSDFCSYFTEPDKAREGYLRAFKEGYVKDFPLVIQDKLGNKTDVLYNATTYTNEAGEIQGVFADARDVTQHKRDEQRIRQQAELLDNAHDAITLRDLDNRLIYCNKGNERLYGWKREEILGKIAHTVFFKDHSTVPMEALKSVKERGEWSGEVHHVTRDGKEIIVDSRWTLMRDHDGNPESILSINTDITEKKKYEAQYLRAQRMESIGTLASGIAHDLNNIFTPILLSVDLFKEKFGDDESQRFLEMLDANIKRGADLTKQILSFTRGIEGERQPVKITRILTEIMKTIKETFPKAIEVHLNMPEEPWAVTGDVTQLHQVFMNLCLNARDAMPFGGSLNIEVENTSIDAEFARMNIDAKVGSYVVISVIDNGIGMAPAVLDRLFEPFFTTKKQGEGTGLGLSMSLGIVKNHGGFIQVYSKVGKGSVFKVFLPSSLAMEGQTEDQKRPVRFQGRGELILIIDDEEMIRTVTAAMLKKNGYAVAVASDGAEGVALYAQQKGKIAAVVLDMMMPIMDGYACIRTLRKIDPQVKILGISGLGRNGKHPEIANRATRFLMKPFTTEKLLESLHDVLS